MSGYGKDLYFIKSLKCRGGNIFPVKKRLKG